MEYGYIINFSGYELLLTGDLVCK